MQVAHCSSTNIFLLFSACDPTAHDLTINAIEVTLPTTTKGGCYFHQKQALWRNLATHNVVPEYRVENSPVRKFSQMIESHRLRTLWRRPRHLAGAKTYPSCRSLRADMDWRRLYWPCPFHHMGLASARQLYNVLACPPRSSDLAEGWHNAFQFLIGCCNPTIWRFIGVLKKEQI